MNRMKPNHIFTCLFFGILFFFAVSCNDDEDPSSATHFRSFATIKGTVDNFTLILDDETTLIVSENNVLFQDNEAINNRRVRATYNVLKEEIISDGVIYFIALNALEEIECREPVYSSVNDGSKLGDDPINILSFWFGGKYLNINYSYFGNHLAAHCINLCIDIQELIEETLSDRRNRTYSVGFFIGFFSGTIKKGGRTILTQKIGPPRPHMEPLPT